MKKGELLQLTVITGAGILLTGQFVSASPGKAQKGEASSESNGAILNTKRTLGSRKSALTVSALSLGCMGIHGGRWIVPDEKAMEKLIRIKELEAKASAFPAVGTAMMPPNRQG